jgi:pimeloyl-ACP methyl ester carboxylesterase
MIMVALEETPVLRFFTLLVMAVLWSGSAAAKYPVARDFTNQSVEDAAFGSINWHVDTVNPNASGPLIVWLPGSGALPFFQKYADGSVGFALPLPLFAHMGDAHFLLVDKPGIPFEANVKFDDARGHPIELDNPVYRAGLTKDQLVARTALAIVKTREALGTRITGLVLIGGSEGAQYAFALARKVNADLVIAWGGIALPQYYDLVIEQRLSAERGEITRDQAQSNVERIYRDVQNVQNDPYDTKARFEGETYRRWSGFGTYAAIDDMLGLDAPLLLIQGGADQSAPILNSDFAKIAFLSRGKTNLDYWVYPNVDHSFQVRSAITKKTPSIENEVWARAWQWMEDHKSCFKSSTRAH